MLGVAGSHVIDVDRLWTAFGPLNVREDQPPTLLLLLKMIGKPASPWQPNYPEPLSRDAIKRQSAMAAEMNATAGYQL